MSDTESKRGESRQSTAPTVPERRGSLRATLLGGNVLALSLVSLLNDAASEMIYPLLPLFLVGPLAASATFLGIIEGIAESASSFLKLASGWLSDRVGRRKPLVVWGYTIAAVTRPVIALATAPWHVLAIRFSDRVGKGMRSAPRDAILAGSVAPERRGVAFGFHRAADHLGAVLGPIFAMLLLLAFDQRLRPVFALAAIPGLVTVLVVLTRVKETGRGRVGSTADATRERHGTGSPEAAEARTEHASGARVGTPRKGIGPAGDTSDRRPLISRPLRAYLSVLVLFTLGNASDAFLVLRAQALGVPIFAIPILWSVHNASKMFWNVPGGLLADRLGSRRAIIAGWFVYAATYIAFGFASQAWHAWALFAVYGLFYGLTEAPEKALVARLAPAEQRGAAFGAFHFAIGIAALPASIAFGAIWEVWSPRAAFLVGAALALLAAAILPLAVPARVDAQPQPSHA